MTGTSIQDFLLFGVLPFGTLLIPVTFVMLWRFRKRTTWAAVFSIAAAGIAGGAALVATLRAFFLLPRFGACLECGIQSWRWYSDAITFAQGFGVTAALALLACLLVFRPNR